MTIFSKFKISVSEHPSEQSNKIIDNAVKLNEQASFVFQSSSVPMMLTNEQFEIAHINDAMRDLFSVNTHAFSRLIGSAHIDQVLGKNIQSLLSTYGGISPDKSTDIECEGSRFRVHIHSLRDPKQSLFGYHVEWHNYTEQLDQSSILKAMDRSQAVIEFTPDGTILNS